MERTCVRAMRGIDKALRDKPKKRMSNLPSTSVGQASVYRSSFKTPSVLLKVSGFCYNKKHDNIFHIDLPRQSYI